MLRAFGASLLDIEKAVDLEDVLVLDHVPTPDDYFEHACGRGIPFVFPFSAPTELLGLPAGGAAADLLEALCERIGDEEVEVLSSTYAPAPPGRFLPCETLRKRMRFDDFSKEAADACRAAEGADGGGTQLLYLQWRGLPSGDEAAAETPPFPDGLRWFLCDLLSAFTDRLPFLHTTTSGAKRPRLDTQERAPARCRQRNFWAGAAVTSRLHFDALDNVHCVWAGKKTVLLFSPFDACVAHVPRERGAGNNWAAAQSVFQAHAARTRRAATSGRGGGVGGGDKKAPAEEQQAASSSREERGEGSDDTPEDMLFRTKPYRAEGQAIFIPAGWWHEVFTHTLTVSSNAWIEAPPAARLRPTLIFLGSDAFDKFRTSGSSAAAAGGV